MGLNGLIDLCRTRSGKCFGGSFFGSKGKFYLLSRADEAWVVYAAEDLTDDLSCSLYDLLTSKRVEGYRNELDERDS